MCTFSLIAVASTLNELWLFDVSKFEKQCSVTRLPYSIECMHYHYDYTNSNRSCLLWGDTGPFQLLIFSKTNTKSHKVAPFPNFTYKYFIILTTFCIQAYEREKHRILFLFSLILGGNVFIIALSETLLTSFFSDTLLNSKREMPLDVFSSGKFPHCKFYQHKNIHSSWTRQIKFLPG